MTNMGRYLAYLDLYIEQYHKTQRVGQMAFNALDRMYPKIADQIRATEIDPFYIENITMIELATFFAKVQDLLGESDEVESQTR